MRRFVPPRIRRQTRARFLPVLLSAACLFLLGSAGPAAADRVIARGPAFGLSAYGGTLVWGNPDGLAVEGCTGPGGRVLSGVLRYRPPTGMGRWRASILAGDRTAACWPPMSAAATTWTSRGASATSTATTSGRGARVRCRTPPRVVGRSSWGPPGAGKSSFSGRAGIGGSRERWEESSAAHLSSGSLGKGA
jgi:hypothetical protein